MILTFIHITPLASAEPREWYVDPVNGSNSNNGDIDHPVQTLTHAMGMAQGTTQPYDVIILRAGVYKEYHNPHESSPIPSYPLPCNLGYPENFPIYLKPNVTIKAYDNEEPILTTANNCNEDILRIYIPTNHGTPGQWTHSSDLEHSQIIGITFKTKHNWPPPGNWWEGSG
jgi:hypothetical protein